MVKIAIAGGTSNVGGEFIDALVATKRHEILVLSRQNVPAEPTEGITWAQTDYADTEALATILTGVHTLLSVITEEDDSSPAQRRLIDACVIAGVKRFAPSEWASSTVTYLPWYTYKQSIRAYLSTLNKNGKRLEYTLFQPGLFTNYLTWPYPSTRYIQPLEIPIDFNNRRAIMVQGAEDAKVSLTTVNDFCAVLVRAVEVDDGEEWPVVSSVSGSTLTLGELMELGQRIRGGEWKIETVKKEDFLSDNWETSWVPRNTHPSIPKDKIEEFSRPGAKGICLGLAEGDFAVGNVWNEILEDGFVFEGAGEFLEGFWGGRE